MSKILSRYVPNKDRKTVTKFIIDNCLELEKITSKINFINVRDKIYFEVVIDYHSITEFIRTHIEVNTSSGKIRVVSNESLEQLLGNEVYK